MWLDISLLKPLTFALAIGGLTGASPVPQQSSSSSSSSSSVSVDFQVSGPNLNVGSSVAEQVIVQHAFANSYGNPFVGTIDTPSTMDFTHVFLKIETTVGGIQYDRLAKLFVNGAEIWRTSTSEPAGGDIYYTYTKDVSKYVNLFKIPNVPVVFDLGNVVNDQYTGTFNVKITAQYYNAGSTASQSSGNSVINSYYERKAPDVITPIRPSNEPINSPFSWSIPGQTAQVDIGALPRNTTRAILDIFASGNGGEEFWYTNFLDEDAGALPSDPQPGGAPCRIVKASIDGEVVATILPFPIIYTGGFAPGLWIPVAGINAYDVPSYQIDVTPFLPKLWSGASIKLEVENGFGGSVGNEWFVNANLLTWEIEGVYGDGQILTGVKAADSNTFTNPANSSTVELMSVARDLSSRAILNFTSSDGSINEQAYFTSSQSVSYNNAKNHYSSGGNAYYQIAQVSSGYNSFKVSNQGVDLSNYINAPSQGTGDFSPILSDTNSDSNLMTVSEWSFIYPMAMNFYPGSTGRAIQADINRGYGYDDNYFTTWTKQNGSTQVIQSSQNSSSSTTNTRSDQYYAQSLVQLSGGRQNYDQYVVTDGYKVVQNTYGNGNTDSLLLYGQTDPITTLLSSAARMAKNNKDDKSGVTSAIINLFDVVVPPIKLISQSTKRSKVFTSSESVLSEAIRAVRKNIERVGSLANGNNIVAEEKEQREDSERLLTGKYSRDLNNLFRTPGYGYPKGSSHKRDVLTTDSTLSRKISEFQVGWDSPSSSGLVCWTCRTVCCETCNCEDGYMYTLEIPGRTSKRSKTEGIKMSKRGANGEIVGLGRNPFYHGSKPTTKKRDNILRRETDDNDNSDNNNNNTSIDVWSKADLLSNSEYYSDGSSLFGNSQACTTCGGGYYGGLSYSFGSNKCSYGSACCSDC